MYLPVVFATLEQRHLSLVERKAKMNKKFRGELPSMTGPATYRIVVLGKLDSSWVSRMGGMCLSSRHSEEGGVETVLVGRLPDQAALSSLLNVLYDLHLPIVSANCLEGERSGIRPGAAEG